MAGLLLTSPTRGCHGCCVNNTGKQTAVFSKEDKVLKFCDWYRAIERESLSEFPNSNWSVSFSNKLLKKIDHTVNETAVLENYIFSAIDINVYNTTLSCI